MSDQSKGQPSEWGTIFSQGREHSLTGLEHSRSTAWTEKDEAAYMDRVRLKAQQLAEGIVAEARMEAEKLRDEARKQGYEAGLAEAGDELTAFRQSMAESVSAVLGAIEGQCSHIFDQWREDLVEVARLAVRRITAVEIAGRRFEVLQGLLIEAVALLEKRRELVIRVNPEDAPHIDEIIKNAKERFEDVQSWRVKADASVSPGGMLVESESSLAEGRLETRIAAVEQIFDHLTLPDRLEAQAEQALPPTAGQA